MLYFLLAFVVYFSSVTIFRWWKEDEQPRNSTNDVGLLRDGLQGHDKGLSEESEDVLCEINGDGSQISSLVFLPDGRQLASACKNESIIRLWSMEHGGEVEPPMNLGVSVTTIAVSKDGKWIVSGGVDGKVVIWNTTSHQKEGESSGSDELKITSLDVSPDSLRVVSGSDDGTVMVWRIDSQSALRLELFPLKLQDLSSVSSVKFSPAGGRIVSSYIRSGHHTIWIWNSWTGHQLSSFPTGGQLTRSLAWSSDGRRLFAGGPNGSIRCFDVGTQKCLAKWEDSRSDVVTSLYVSNTSQFLISASASGRTLDIWDIRVISACQLLRSYRRCEVLSVAISPNELYLVSGGKDKKINRRSLPEAIKPSYFYHCLTSLPRLSEPLTYISNAAYEMWIDGKLGETEEILSNEIADEGCQDFVHYARANRSLVRTRLRKWDEALEDAEATMSHNGQKLLIAYIAKGIALYGQGKREGAEDTLDMAKRDCDGDGDTQGFVERVRSLILSEVEHQDKLCCGTEPPDRFQDVNICPLVKAQKLVHFAELHIRKREYDVALQLLSSAPDLSPFLYVPEAKVIFMIVGWNLHDLQFMIHQLKFQALAASGRTKEAIELFSTNENIISEDTEKKNVVLGWLSEKLGDKSMCFSSYDDAIAWYTAALAFFPESGVAYSVPDLARRCLATFDVVNNAPTSERDEATALSMELLSSHPKRTVCLLLKRSKAEAEAESWKDALKDANEAIRLDPLCLWGYERRRAAMFVRQCHEVRIEGFNGVLLTVERQINQDIFQPGKSHVSCEVVVDAAIHRIAEFCPLVLIDVKTGFLCDEAKRKHIFKEDPIYDKLLSSSSTHMDIKHIVHVVAQFFRYVMFSHTWEGEEPTYQDVSKSLEKSIYKLDSSSRLNEKLCKFCETVGNDCEGYRWSWSDTCCIDKTIEAVYKKSICSMYDWYKWSALTVVLLVDDFELKDSRWMTRAWTLQELLSPNAIRFYDRNWKPYRGDPNTNHKKSPRILRELAEAIYVAPDALADFSPETLGVREKLRLASTRNATKEEDIAYSLIGIFSSHLTPEPRDAAIALGLLLQEIVVHYQETAVLDWTGEPSRFNSCLPARISVYRSMPYIVPSIADDNMEKQVAELRRLSTLQQDAIKLYHKFSRLDDLFFANHRLHLPCITFPITVTKCDATSQRQTRSTGTIYLAKASALGEVEFTTMETLSSQDRLMLVYPWIRDLRTQAHLPEGDPDTQASRLIVHLEQPFRALLLAKHPVHNEYRRIATDSEILVPRHKLTSLKDMDAERLVVL